MAKIDFDHGGITYGIDFDAMTPTEIANRLGLDADSGARMKAAVAALGIDAAAQAQVNKLVGAAIVLGSSAATSQLAPILAGLL